MARDDERRFALRVLDTILGGTSSSRLFQEVREQRGLAYTVSASPAHYPDAGQIGLYVGTRPDNVARRSVSATSSTGCCGTAVTDDELARAKDNAQGPRRAVARVDVARMNRLGGACSPTLPLLSVDELIARIDAVRSRTSRARVASCSRPSALSAAAIGPDGDASAPRSRRSSPELAEAA